MHLTSTLHPKSQFFLQQKIHISSTSILCSKIQKEMNKIIMSPPSIFPLLILTISLSFILISSSPNPSSLYQSFTNCLSLHTPLSTNLSQLISTPSSPSFTSLLQSSVRNLRFLNPTTREPAVILTATETAHVQASVVCCRNHSLPLRIRSGGHDYEGLSYRSDSNRVFAVLDLGYLRSVAFDLDRNAAWVESGSTLGEFYYQIDRKSGVHGFPAGVCPTVGVGGHVSGGGFGTMLRKYGLASDNVIDAILVDVNGRVLDRESMGEDLFWAIRGGGSSSFGVVVSWKVSLVPVPKTVAVFSIHKTLGQGAVELVDKWQYIAHRLPDELFVRIVIQKNDQGSEVEALFNSLFLGNCDDLVRLMGERFSDLGFARDDCREMSWVNSVMYFAGYTNGEALEELLDRGSPYRFFKAKSDFVTEPVPRFVFERIWARFMEDGAGVLIMDPYGGKMSIILESETAFPHRKGNLYNLQYFVEWTERGEEASRKRMDWIKRLYNEMGPYVSKNPRASYVNYRDLDLGMNGEGNESSYSNAEVWGAKYYKSNFARLARVKARVDPSDFFWNEQSIPPLVEEEEGREGESELVSMSLIERSSHYQAWIPFLLSKLF